MNGSTLPAVITDLEPCGPSLEYDPEFTVLLARVSPRAGVQYGHFLDTPEPPHWTEIERDCRSLLARSIDINLLVWLCRAATRLRHAAGLAQALGTLHAALHTWPQAIHPQLTIDGEREPAVRANALAALSDPQGLISDVLELKLSGSNRSGLTVREVQRAFSAARPKDAPDRESVSAELDSLRAGEHGVASSPVNQLAQAATALRQIASWAQRELGDAAPDLAPVSRLLDLFLPPSAAVSTAPRPASVCAPTTAHQARTLSDTRVAMSNDTPTGSRHDALADIQRVRQWFEFHEPSSPVAVLLRQAERLVGKDFSQVVDAIPADLLKQWTTARDDA